MPPGYQQGPKPLLNMGKQFGQTQSLVAGTPHLWALHTANNNMVARRNTNIKERTRARSGEPVQYVARGSVEAPVYAHRFIRASASPRERAFNEKLLVAKHDKHIQLDYAEPPADVRWTTRLSANGRDGDVAATRPSTQEEISEAVNRRRIITRTGKPLDVFDSALVASGTDANIVTSSGAEDS